MTTGHLLSGLLAEGGNLALQILTTMDVAPASLTPSDEPEPGSGGGDGLRFSQPAAIALEQTVGEAIGLGHNYVGCEHLLIALAGEPEGKAGELLRSRGVEARSARQSVAAALAGYAHLRAAMGPQQPAASSLLTAVRAELAPLVERIERLEARLNWRSALEQGGDLGGDVVGGAAVGGDRVGGHLGVERAALVEQVFQGGPRVDRQQRAAARSGPTRLTASASSTDR